MILALSIGVSALTALLFFRDFFSDWSEFAGGLFRRPTHDGVTGYLNDPEGADDNGFALLNTVIYLAAVIGSGVIVFAIFRGYFGSEI